MFCGGLKTPGSSFEPTPRTLRRYATWKKAVRVYEEKAQTQGELHALCSRCAAECQKACFESHRGDSKAARPSRYEGLRKACLRKAAKRSAAAQRRAVRRARGCGIGV